MQAIREAIYNVLVAENPMTVRQVFYQLVGRGAVEKTDSRSKGFEGESVEVDAIPSAQLRAMVRACIERHIDNRILQATQFIEQQERDTLIRVLGNAEAGR